AHDIGRYGEVTSAGTHCSEQEFVARIRPATILDRHLVRKRKYTRAGVPLRSVRGACCHGKRFGEGAFVQLSRALYGHLYGAGSPRKRQDRIIYAVRHVLSARRGQREKEEGPGKIFRGPLVFATAFVPLVRQ